MAASASSHDAITALLADSDTIGEERMDQLLPLVYGQLREMAHRHLTRERRAHTLNTTALVHEAYLKLVDQTQVTARGKSYFFGAAARAMRRVLVDHARHRTRQKRGGSQHPITLEESLLRIDTFAADLIDLDDALTRLTALYPRQARVVECRFFGGLSVRETAAVIDVSPRTVKSDWALAKAWLYRSLNEASSDE